MRRSLQGLALSLAIAATAPASSHAEDAYKVDAVHSSVVFRVKHMNTSYAYGRFNGISGSFALNAATPSASVLDIAVKTETIDTASGARDTHLKGPDFFNAKQFPGISFKGTSFKKTGESTYEVTGDLTLHGVTNPVTAVVEATGEGKGQRGRSIAGIEAVFNIKRTDFGMKNMVGPVGDDVKITVALEGGR